jgi:nicotinamide phosphoribosyltransferase
MDLIEALYGGNFNPLMATDSYKHSHWLMYPKGTTYVQNYMEFRNFKFNDPIPEQDAVVFGQQKFVKFLERFRITHDHVEEAYELLGQHFNNYNVFDHAGFSNIVNKHDGFLPLIVKGVPDGTTLPIRNALMTIGNTDPACFSLPGFVEGTALHITYASAVATYSRSIKKLIIEHLLRTGGPVEAADFMMHDFGYRGVSGYEQAMMGGMAHLTSFLGTDTLPALMGAKNFYNAKGAIGFSVPAAEHGPVSSFGRLGELDAFKQILEAYPTGTVSVISDTWDVFNASENLFGSVLKDNILSRDGKVVLRPDSGNPVDVNRKLLNILWDKFGGTLTSTGHKVLHKNIGIIQGDGINYSTISAILNMAETEGFAAHNFVFGSGGNLLMNHNRDELGAAIKVSYRREGNVPFEVYKDPITASGSKTSKKGLTLLVKEDGQYKTVETMTLGYRESENLLKPIFHNGKALLNDNWDSVRANAAIKDSEMSEIIKRVSEYQVVTGKNI